MMINKRLLKIVKDSKIYIVGDVLNMWLGLLANIGLMVTITAVIRKLLSGGYTIADLESLLMVGGVVALVKFLTVMLADRYSFMAARSVKKLLRAKIYEKLLRLGPSYRESAATSVIVQTSVEGVDQLETYFGSYLPQFFYSLLAPLTLFAVLVFIDAPAALVLLACVPLIPLAIAAVQTIAKRLLRRYWDRYTSLGDSFLENLRGLTTLKIYQSDGYRHEKMNEESERFRIATMKVLRMQLNSITIMDLVAYGGAALGAVIAIREYGMGFIDLPNALLIIMLAADFFIPMRRLGSFFHIAMNGMAASDKIFAVLDLAEPQSGDQPFPEDFDKIVLNGLDFAYDADRPVLNRVDITIPRQGLVAIVGESGVGKSTIAGILMKRNRDYHGAALIKDIPLNDISEASLLRNITYVGTNNYLFKDTVRGNLLAADPTTDDERLWEVLKQVDLADFLSGEQGLDTLVMAGGTNLSGGQQQRLALARALLHDSPVYIFDEATSNIDMESETIIMEQIYVLAQTKTVLLISHRLANVVKAAKIYVLRDGRIAEMGDHNGLLEHHGEYYRLWDTQSRIENMDMEAAL